MEHGQLKWLYRVFSIIFGIIALIIFSGFIYIQDYHRANTDALNAIESPAVSIKVENDGNHILAFIPEEPIAGFIFYPGAKVQYESYAPLMEACAEQNMLCAIPRMPGNLALLDIEAAKNIQEDFPQIKNWYIGGHSMGGAMAAWYAAEHPNELDGLILLASYSTKNLTDSDLRVLSVVASEDHILNWENYRDSFKNNLPADTGEFIIDGGCHAYFGCYGPQGGDGVPRITNQEQIDQTADTISQFITSLARAESIQKDS